MFDSTRFIELYENKKVPIKQIAEEFNISPRVVYTKAKKLNLKIRSEKKYKIPEIGANFHKLTFIREECGTGCRKYWVCECECGSIKSFPYWGVFSGKTKSCGCYQKEMVSKQNWKGCGEISGKYWTSIKEGAKRRQLDFTLTIEHGWDLYIKQDKKCAISGLDIGFSRMRNLFPQTASLDRIDNSKGYTLDNVQWLHKMVNVMKHCMDQDYFVNLCMIITDNHRLKQKG